MRPPSLIYKKNVASLVGDRMFLAGVKRDIDKGNMVKQGMEGSFGAMLMTMIENIERELYLKSIEMPAWRLFEQIRVRAELSAVQHLKGSILAKVDNGDALFKEMERLEGSDY